jgi:hypothetical protein
MEAIAQSRQRLHACQSDEHVLGSRSESCTNDPSCSHMLSRIQTDMRANSKQTSNGVFKANIVQNAQRSQTNHRPSLASLSFIIVAFDSGVLASLLCSHTYAHVQQQQRCGCNISTCNLQVHAIVKFEERAQVAHVMRLLRSLESSPVLLPGILMKCFSCALSRWWSSRCVDDKNSARSCAHGFREQIYCRRSLLLQSRSLALMARHHESKTCGRDIRPQRLG